MAHSAKALSTGQENGTRGRLTTAANPHQLVAFLREAIPAGFSLSSHQATDPVSRPAFRIKRSHFTMSLRAEEQAESPLLRGHF